MGRSFLDSLVTEKSLAFINNNRELADHCINSPQSEPLSEKLLDGLTPEQADEFRQFHAQIFIETKNVCAKVSPVLAKEIDDVCSDLGISKRRFLEAAFVDAVSRAKAIMEAEGVYELMEAQSS